MLLDWLIVGITLWVFCLGLVPLRLFLTLLVFVEFVYFGGFMVCTVFVDFLCWFGVI